MFYMSGNVVVSAAELESIKSLFSEKEKELVNAVARVEALTHQLEDLRHGRVAGPQTESKAQPGAAPSMAELEKMRQELAVSFPAYDFVL